jgi:hypothetical protein
MQRCALLLLLASCATLACSEKRRSSVDPAKESASSKRRGEADAEADIAKGKASIMVSSGVARFPLTADYDGETGLPLQDTGCAYDPVFNDTYNAAIRAWIAKSGLPASSLKPRMLDAAALDGALQGAAKLEVGAPARAPDGRLIELRNGNIHVEGGGFQPPFEHGLGLGKDATVRFAWAPRQQLVLLVEGSPHEGFRGRARVQIDPGCRCFLQVLQGT